MTETPEKEFDEVFGRVTQHVDLTNIFTEEDIIKKIDTEYPLAEGNLENIIYKEMGKRSHLDIQKNLIEWTEGNTKPEDYILPDQEEELYEKAINAFTDDQIEKFKNEVSDTTTENLMDIMVETEATHEDRKVAADYVAQEEKPPQTEKLEKVLKTNKEILKPREGTLFSKEQEGRIRTFRRRGWYDDVLDLLQQPKSSYDLERELKERGIGTDMKDGVLARRARSINAALRNQGYAQTVKGQKTQLTRKGKNLLKRIQEENA